MECYAEELGGEIEFISTSINDRKFVPASSACFFFLMLFLLCLTLFFCYMTFPHYNTLM